MFRYTQDCPDCNGLGYVSCPTCQAPGEWRCRHYPDYTCPFTGEERNPPRCSRCGGYGQVFVTETPMSNGRIERTEVSMAYESSQFMNSVKRHWEAIDAFEESIYALVDTGFAESYHLAYPQDFEEEIASGTIQDPLLREQLPKEGNDALGLRHTKNRSFLIILGQYGIYLPEEDHYKYIPREDLVAASENADKLLVEYTEELLNLEFARTEENDLYLRPIRLLLQTIIRDGKEKEKGGFTAFVMDCVFQKYAKRLSRQGKAHAFDPVASPRPRKAAEKKLRQVLFSYAAKIRRKDVLFFVDASEGDANDRGMVFSFEGISFCNGTNYGYIPYESIRYMTVNKSRTALTLHGTFDECVKPCKRVSFRSTEYNMDALEGCFRELLLLV